MSARPELAAVDAKERRRTVRLYDLTWGRTRRGPGWPDPEGTQTLRVPAPIGTITAKHLPGTPGGGTVVLAHPDRRYAGHWFVREGIVDTLHRAGHGCVWFDQRGYGTGGKDGSPFLYENVVAVAKAGAALDDGPLFLYGISLGAFAAMIASPHIRDLAGLIAESPYPSFHSWYDHHGRWNLDRLAISVFSLFIRKSMPAIDAPAKVARSPAPVLAAATEADQVTPIHLSLDSLSTRPDNTQWLVYKKPAHLEIWRDEPTYRQAILDFLQAPDRPVAAAAQQARA